MDADWVREARRAAGMTQVKLASALGVSRITVARWETGVYPVSQAMGLAIRAVTGYPPETPVRRRRAK